MPSQPALTPSAPLDSAGWIAGQHVPLPSEGATFAAVDAASWEPLPGRFAEARPAAIEQAGAAAAEAFDFLRQSPPAQRAELLRAVADIMTTVRDEIEKRVAQETGYLPERVAGEFDRAHGQLLGFAELARRASWNDWTIDPAEPNRSPRPRPELRRRLFPVGPVAVFGACNFPLAISVIGNDFVAAIAAGCPVIVKSHPFHPGSCEMLGRIATEAVRQTNFPPGTFSLLHGRQSGTSLRLVQHPAIAAVGFTGSPRGGRAITEAALQRGRPIPVFAELGSTNPVFLTEAALQQRLDSIAEGFLQSIRFGNGHMCTKPGVIVLPESQRQAFVDEVQTQLAQCEPLPMLAPPIAEAFDAGVAQIRQTDSVTSEINLGRDTKTLRDLRLFSLPAERAISHEMLHVETFGPLAMLITCRDETEMCEVAKHFQGSLTTTLHSNPAEATFRRDWIAQATRFAGRVLADSWPTGMEIGWATQHGGPFPASIDPRTTSIGFHSVDRFLRPVCFQNWGEAALADSHLTS